MKKASLFLFGLVSLSMIPLSASADDLTKGTESRSGGGAAFGYYIGAPSYAALTDAGLLSSSSVASSTPAKTSIFSVRNFAYYQVNSSLPQSQFINTLVGFPLPLSQGVASPQATQCINDAGKPLFETLAHSKEASKFLHRFPLNNLYFYVVNNATDASIKEDTISTGIAIISDNDFIVQIVIGKDGKCIYPSEAEITKRLVAWENSIGNMGKVIENLNSLTAVANLNPDDVKSADRNSVVKSGYGNPDGGSLTPIYQSSMSGK